MGLMLQRPKRSKKTQNTRAPRYLVIHIKVRWESNISFQVPFGFSVLGIISHNKEGVKRLNKAFGRSLCAKNIHDVLTNFIRLDTEQSILVANIFLEKLEEFIDFFSSQRHYHLYASSLLFVYDFASLQEGNLEQFKGTVRLKLIDFAHVFPANGLGDDNFIFGLKNLSDLFRKFIADQTT